MSALRNSLSSCACCWTNAESRAMSASSVEITPPPSPLEELDSTILLEIPLVDIPLVDIPLADIPLADIPLVDAPLVDMADFE